MKFRGRLSDISDDYRSVDAFPTGIFSASKSLHFERLADSKRPLLNAEFVVKINHMPASPSELVNRCQTVLAHAWMVRTFVKHSTEVEDFPELMGIVRGVFDLSRAVETRVEEPAEYFKMLDKKLSGLRSAVEKFAIDAPLASTHTNFIQAVISIRASTEELAELCAQGLQQTSTVKAPPSITKPIPRRPSPPSLNPPGSDE